MAKAIGSGERERRKGLLAEWRRSGLSAAGFGERHGLSQWALYAWAKDLGGGAHRRRRKRRPAPRSTAGAIPRKDARRKFGYKTNLSKRSKT